MSRNSIVLLTAVLGLSVIGYSFTVKPETNISLSTVKITNLQGNSGGSGTIVRSYTNFSEVLTNSHVCEVVKNGGLVHSNTGSHFVIAYKQSLTHDLCLIEVPGNLGADTNVSDKAPKVLDAATVSGHPHLLPIIITQGHFSGRMVVQIMTGVKQCTSEDFEDPETTLFCLLAGGLPIIKSYDSIIVSALIQAGSSGSAVYTSNKEIGSVIFAGSGDISFGIAVPYEYVRYFLEEEVQNLKVQVPDTSSLVQRTQSKREYIKKVLQICENKEDNRICQHFASGEIFTNE